MTGRSYKNTRQTLQNARGGLTNGLTCYSLMLDQNDKANCARCANTSHSSDPTLCVPVNGLRCIIQNRETPVLHGFSGPTDRIGLANACVRVGRFAVLTLGGM